MPLFVYGTLMRGEAASGLLAPARYLGRGRTAPRFELVDCGDYPALVRGGATAVAGELYDVGADVLPSLDDYEGCPDVFVREPVEIERDGGAPLSCDAYLMPRARALGRPRIACGDWKARPR